MRPFILAAPAIVVPAAHAVTPPEPYGAVPSAKQVAWHEMEFYGLIHYSMNTYTNTEWGYGSEKPTEFNPRTVDCPQWASVAKSAGMTGLVLVAKHHDGFCLWPSEQTEHSVENSGYHSAFGDIVKECMMACRGADLQFGVYLSPWDRNHKDYGKPAYVKYYREQLKELLTNYGPLFEVWFDGANGGDGWYGGAKEKRTIDRTTYYNWPAIFDLVHTKQPKAVIFSDAGPECRWVGNESGQAAETSWQTINLEGMYPGCDCGPKLPGGEKGGKNWVGVEADTPLRPSWFYHRQEDSQVKKPEKLETIWYETVGRGANLILGLSPNQQGRLADPDVKALQGLRDRLDATFTNNFARGRKATASNTRGNDASFGPELALDGDSATYWATDDGVTTAELVVPLAERTNVNVIRVKEAIALGQRVEEFAVDYWTGSEWKEFAKGTTIGPRRILRTETVSTDKLRLRIVKSGASPCISEFGAYLRPKF